MGLIGFKSILDFSRGLRRLRSKAPNRPGRPESRESGSRRLREPRRRQEREAAERVSFRQRRRRRGRREVLSPESRKEEDVRPKELSDDHLIFRVSSVLLNLRDREDEASEVVSEIVSGISGELVLSEDRLLIVDVRPDFDRRFYFQRNSPSRLSDRIPLFPVICSVIAKTFDIDQKIIQRTRRKVEDRLILVAKKTGRLRRRDLFDLLNFIVDLNECRIASDRPSFYIERVRKSDLRTSGLLSASSEEHSFFNSKPIPGGNRSRSSLPDESHFEGMIRNRRVVEGLKDSPSADFE